MKNINVERKGTKTIVTYERKNKPVKIYYNDKLYAKVDINKPSKRVRKGRGIFEKVLITGIFLFFASSIIAGLIVGKNEVAQAKEIAKELPKPIVIEKIVKVKDDTIPPILKKIFECESGGKHYDKNGKVIKGKVDSDDTGVAQINLRYHGKEAKRLGYDLMTEKGNIGYAKYLLENFGTKFWSASAKCWSKK